ncbi:metallophosphoesterase [Halobacteria archaeon AArc-curdl1]|uniref:Phosphoesterase n=1 Tax=Natronosalvus hydrolyticus TaxID=2979988 RepID=A0AAP2ZAB1_9EURY|nr:metallophosphoesterase [Halobacteria archaeon AArc-curdl1]
MLAVFADTHSARGHELEGAALNAATEAEAVIHAGDFTSQSALEAFKERCPVFYPVHGNADNYIVTEALPTTRTVEYKGLTIAVTHRRDGGDTGLAMFGRAQNADIVVSAHTHRPRILELEDVVLLNPGSHAQPRGNRPGFATVERRDDSFDVRLQTPSGEPIDSLTLEGERLE